MNEAKQKWGNTKAYLEFEEKSKDYSNNKWNELSRLMDEILKEFSINLENNIPYNSKETLNLVKKLQAHITDNYYTCTNEILYGLGEMYVLDERFRNNIDKFKEGNAQYIKNAITVYCNK